MPLPWLHALKGFDGSLLLPISAQARSRGRQDVIVRQSACRPGEDAGQLEHSAAPVGPQGGDYRVGENSAEVTPLMDGETLQELFTTSWDGAAPATWNRHLATLGSFTAYAVRRRWLEADPATGLQRRKEIIDRTRSIDPAALQRLFDLPGVRLRERTLWRMLYETAARAEEILTLDIGDLDLDDKRARIRAKGGAIEYVFWQTGTARLLPT